MKSAGNSAAAAELGADILIGEIENITYCGSLIARNEMNGRLTELTNPDGGVTDGRLTTPTAPRTMQQTLAKRGPGRKRTP